MEKLSRLQERLGYHFHDGGLLEQALTHRSASRRDNNERLEFLGDAQLGQIISVALFRRFPEAAEGQLTRMRAWLVRGQTLAEVGRELGLGECLHLGGGELKSGGFRRASILADAVEAIIGAVLLDGGEDASRDVVLGWFGNRLERVSPELVRKDPKTRLQEWLQSRQYPLPEYQVDDIRGRAPDQEFDVSCHLVAMESCFRATAPSRRKAEQAAAALALEWLDAEQREKS